MPTKLSQFATVTATIITTVLDFQGSTITLVVGPSGKGWTPFNKPSGAADVPAPSVLPSVSDQSSASSSEASSAVSSSARSSSSDPLNSRSGETLFTSNVGSQTVIETFVPVIISELASLTSTITTTILNAQQSPEIIVVGPGGIA